MAVSVPQRSFTGGEWGPSLAARVDLAKYGTALKHCENFVVQSFGGISTRPGTRFLAEAKDSTKPVRLIPFQFSVEQGYILEFGDQTMRVYKDGALVLSDTSSIANWAVSTAYNVGYFAMGTLDSSQTSMWTLGASYQIGDYVNYVIYIPAPLIIYSRCISPHIATVSNAPTNADTAEWEWLGPTPKGAYRCILNHTSTANDEPWVGPAWTTYWVLDGVGNGVYEIATPYAAEDLALLKFEQSYDYLFLQHPEYAPQELTRSGHAAWAINPVTFGAGIGAPTTLAGGTGSTHNWQVTAVSTDGEESAPSNTHSAASGTLTWTAPVVGTVHYYNVYMQKNNSGFFGWVARVPSNSHLIDATVSPDPDKSPPEPQTPFAAPDDYPGVATFFEQRLLYARTNNEPQAIWGSVTGSIRNFNISTPLQADDSYKFTLVSRQLHDIRWMMPLEDLLIGTGSGEWRMRAGGNSDAITPTSVDLKQQSDWGSSDLRPLLVGNTILFVDASKKVVRDLLFSFDVDSYQGNDLTLLAPHLFKDREIVDFAYAQHPIPVVWCVRDDGVLLGMTYVREHEVWGWHRHTTQGNVENVATIFNAAGDVDTYVVVNRTVGGTEKRFIEVFEERLPDDDVEKAWCIDSALQYDGYNTDATHTMQLTGGSTWKVGESLTLTASDSTFVAGDVGTYWKLRKIGDQSTSVIVEVTAFTSDTIVTVTPFNRTVPTDLRATDTDDWGRCVTTLSGLDHLEGKTVKVLADGNVKPDKTVTSGAITIVEPAVIVTVGLGFTCTMETLEIEIAAEGATLQDRLRNAVSVMTRLEKSRELFIGPDSDNLDPAAFREDELYGEPTELYTGDKEMFIEPSDGTTGRIVIQVQEPVPCTVLSIIPKMVFSDIE